MLLRTINVRGPFPAVFVFALLAGCTAGGLHEAADSALGGASPVTSAPQVLQSAAAASPVAERPPVPATSSPVPVTAGSPTPRATGSPTPRTTSPTPTPTPTATRSPLPVRTASPGPTAVPNVSLPIAQPLLAPILGQLLPTTFLDTSYGATGPLFQQLPANPTLDPQDASYRSEYFSSQANYQAGWVDNDSTQAQFDYNFPVFVASGTDPVVTLHCTDNFGNDDCGAEGDRVHVPVNATQAGGSDHHMILIEPDGITEYDMWEVQTSPPHKAGETLSFGWGNKLRLDGKPLARTQACQARGDCTDIAPGFEMGATAGNQSLLLSQVFISELSRGSINHALYIVANCIGGTPVFPATIPDNHCINNEGFPLGTRLWYDLTDAQVSALPGLNADQKTILRAMHHYGAFVSDIGGCRGTSCSPGNGLVSHIENQEPYWTYGRGVDPAVNYAVNHGWQHVVSGAVNRWSLEMDGPTIDFLDHLHVLAPCITTKAC